MRWDKIDEIYEGDRELKCFAYRLDETHPKYGQSIFVAENKVGTFDVEYYAYGGFCTIETLLTMAEARTWVERFVADILAELDAYDGNYTANFYEIVEEELKDWGLEDEAC